MGSTISEEVSKCPIVARLKNIDVCEYVSDIWMMMNMVKRSTDTSIGY
jgi:hypothetical protein